MHSGKVSMLQCDNYGVIGRNHFDVLGTAIVGSMKISAQSSKKPMISNEFNKVHRWIMLKMMMITLAANKIKYTYFRLSNVPRFTTSLGRYF